MDNIGISKAILYSLYLKTRRLNWRLYMYMRHWHRIKTAFSRIMKTKHRLTAGTWLIKSSLCLRHKWRANQESTSTTVVNCGSWNLGTSGCNKKSLRRWEGVDLFFSLMMSLLSLWMMLFLLMGNGVVRLYHHSREPRKLWSSCRNMLKPKGDLW